MMQSDSGTYCARALLSLFLSILPLYGFSQLSVSPNKTALQLAQTLAGKGISVSNATLTCPGLANGTFISVNTNLGLDSGIVLTSGRASALVGAQSQLANYSNSSPGDADLDMLAGQNTHDACALELDFIPKGDTVRFDYVFSSEEYINATCGPYNDAFGFFISGPGIVGQQNIALVPGTNIPVAINSINSGVPGSGYSLATCQAMGPGSPFIQYYIDNNGTFFTHEGFTTVLQAVHEVTACSTYHLKIAIADAGNFQYDSGVFLKAGSLQTNTLSVLALGGGGDTLASAFAVKGCNNGGFLVSRPNAGVQALAVNYTLSGTAQSGLDYSPMSGTALIPPNERSVFVAVNTLPTALNGVKELELKVLSPYTCNSGNQVMDSARLLIYDTIFAELLTADTTICRFQSVQINTTGSDSLQYSWSPGGGLNSTNLAEPVASPAQSTTYVMDAYWPGSGCNSILDSVSIQILPVPYIELDTLLKACLGGSLIFDPILNPDSAGYQYQWTGPNGFSDDKLQTSISNIKLADSGMYVLSVSVNNGCDAAMDSVRVYVIAPPPPVSLKSPYNFCRATVEEHLADVGDSLTWYMAPQGGLGTPLIPLNNFSYNGLYYFYVSFTENGCEGPRTRTMVRVQECCEDNIFIPDAFTPNGDGKNDLLTFTRSDDHHVEEVKIFNRWGERVFQSMDGSPAWDGNYKGIPAEVGNYYYILLMKCNTGTEVTRKGEFLLIR